MTDARTPPPVAALHHAILSTIVETGAAPMSAELAERFGVGRDTVVEGLRALEVAHGVVLHPHTPEVWVAHPFATAPTPFTVRTGTRVWWGNCAWCALGVAHLVGGVGEPAPVTITTTLGGEDEQVTLRVEPDGTSADDDFVVHFPVPMRHAWDNVVYTCSVMLLFASADDVDRWCARHRVARGDVQPVGTVRRFAADWYGRHLDPDWRKWTTDEAAAIFARHGLRGPIWDVDASGGRF